MSDNEEDESVADADEVDSAVAERFHRALRDLRDNENRHVIPRFLLEPIDVEATVREIRREARKESTLFGKKDEE